MNGNTMTLNFAGQTRPIHGQAAAICEETAVPDYKELFLQLLVPVKKFLYNFIQKSMNFSADADDIFQDTLLKGFRYFHSFDRDRSFKTWIFTIAHNLMKDHFSTNNALLPATDIEQLEDGVNRRVPEDAREIYSAAKKLKPKHREVFFLFYYNEFKIPEIADITGLTKVNVKFILQQARKSVKKILEVQL
ncbi:MAG: RNA polymerase sigma factor [bacterium]|nr:RNA polymerase sigma factor [bacterium]